MAQSEWTPREVTQAKCGPKDGSKKHTASVSKAFLAKMSQEGYGSIVKSGNRPFVFKRKNVLDLDDAQKKFCFDEQ